MWKKFCVSILSLCLLGGAAIVSGSLFAADESVLQFINKEQAHHYVNDEFSYTLKSSHSDEQILYISGGELHGGAFTYQIPFYKGNSVSVSQINKPGVYQGEVAAEVSEGSGDTKEITGILAFTVYGIVYQNDTCQMQVSQVIKPETYGSLPKEVTPLFTYTSDDEAVATVDANGNITAVGEGSTIIHMVVFDGAPKEEQRLYESTIQIQVGKSSHIANTAQVQKGEDYGYRFVQTESVDTDAQKQKIGFIAHPQSGTYRYEIEAKQKQLYEIKDGELYALKKQTAGKHSVIIYLTAEETNQAYAVTCSYEAAAKKADNEEQFKFRYEGKDAASIVRPYQEGNNSFQITSNKSLDEVQFQLKEESDSQYLSVSQTGNVIVKKISEQPVVIVARWQKQSFECPVMIEKADQQISVVNREIVVSPDDGRFDPLIQGRSGSGSLVADITADNECISLHYSEQGDFMIQPLKAGDAQISVYNDGDQNYKKSNVVTINVHVKEAQAFNDAWVGDAKWLSVEGTTGNNGWFTSAVTLTPQKDAPINEFYYLDQAYNKLPWSQNGIAALPITFTNEQGMTSSVAKVSLKLDTHAPLITAISERKAQDREWKEFIDCLTFQSVFGQGMIIEIHADDALMDQAVKTSGVERIDYHIYRIEAEKEILLTSGSVDADSADIKVEDLGVHKVCAKAVDYAGLEGEEVCRVLDHEATATITSENTAMMLSSRAFTEDDKIFVHALGDDEISKVKTALMNSGTDEITAVSGYRLEWVDHPNAVPNQAIQAIIPMTNQSEASGYWIQRQGDGTFVPLETEQHQDAQILHLQSLDQIYYVETKHNAAAGNLGLYFAKPNDVWDSHPNILTEVTKTAFQTPTFAAKDVQIVLYGGGATLIVCFIILLIRSGREEE